MNDVNRRLWLIRAFYGAMALPLQGCASMLTRRKAESGPVEPANLVASRNTVIPVPASTFASSPVLNEIFDSQFNLEILKNSMRHCENAIGPSPKAMSAIHSVPPELHRYEVMDKANQVLSDRLAQLHQTRAGSIVLFPGSREGIRSWIRQCRRNGKFNFLVCDREYPKAAECATENGVPLKKIEVLPNCKLDLARFADYARDHDLIYLSNPHLPFGGFYEPNELATMLRRIPKTCRILIDEAYIHFLGGDYEKRSAIALLSEFPNVFVSRTFSKVYGLASARLGYLVGDHNLIREMFPTLEDELARVSSLAGIAGIAALSDLEHVEKSLLKNEAIRNDLSSFARANGIQLLPGFGNFAVLLFPQGFPLKGKQSEFAPFTVFPRKIHNQPYLFVSFKDEANLQIFKSLVSAVIKNAH